LLLLLLLTVTDIYAVLDRSECKATVRAFYICRQENRFGEVVDFPNNSRVSDARFQACTTMQYHILYCKVDKRRIILKLILHVGGMVMIGDTC
jgi:hypothetical protein